MAKLAILELRRPKWSWKRFFSNKMFKQIFPKPMTLTKFWDFWDNWHLTDHFTWHTVTDWLQKYICATRRVNPGYKLASQVPTHFWDKVVWAEFLSFIKSTSQELGTFGLCTIHSPILSNSPKLDKLSMHEYSIIWIFFT
jgi:hypothetical protein